MFLCQGAGLRGYTIEFVCDISVLRSSWFGVYVCVRVCVCVLMCSVCVCVGVARTRTLLLSHDSFSGS